MLQNVKAVYYKIVVHIFDLQEKTTSTVDKDNKTTTEKWVKPKIVNDLTHHKNSFFFL